MENAETTQPTEERGEGVLIVVTGPSGAGKDSVIERAQELGLEFHSAVTTSTRAMRPGEAEGQPYYFITGEEFEKKIERNEMVEWAQVYGHYYGCTREEVDRVRKEHPVVIMKVDPQGARTYKEMIPDCVTVFIAPPSIEFLRSRLVKRGTDSADVIEQRLAVAEEEMQNMDQWDAVIANEEDRLDQAAQQLIHIIEEHIQ